MLGVWLSDGSDKVTSKKLNMAGKVIEVGKNKNLLSFKGDFVHFFVKR